MEHTLRNYWIGNSKPRYLHLKVCVKIQRMEEPRQGLLTASDALTPETQNVQYAVEDGSWDDVEDIIHELERNFDHIRRVAQKPG